MRALDLARAARDRRHEARWLATLGQALWRFEQPQEAMRALNDALGAAQRVEDLALQASVLTQLGRIYAAGGQTAAFLRGGDDAGALIDRLVQAADEPAPAPDRPAASLPAVPTAAAGPDADMLSQLLKPKAEPEAPKAPPAPIAPPKDVNRSVIDSLLDGGPGGNQSGNQGGGKGGGA